MKQKKRIPWLTLLGILMILGGLAGLFTGPSVSQYVFLPGEIDGAALLKTADEKFEGAFSATSLHGVTEDVSLKAGETSQGEITLYQTLGDYFHVYPRTFAAGRPLAWSEGSARVIVLDSALAFKLFGDQDPLDRSAELNGKSYRVVGVAAHSQRPGERGAYTAWIPLGAADAPEETVLVLSASGGAGNSLRTVFETVARETFGSGQAIFPDKERMRGTVMLQAVMLILGVTILMRWIRFLAGRFRVRTAELRQRMETRYPRQMLGQIVGRGLEMLLLTAGTVAVGAWMVSRIGDLMMVFPEWIPENLVSAAAIAGRFRSLMGTAAEPIQFRTPELAEIRLWSGMIRWGTVLALTGWAIRPGARRTGQNPEAEQGEAGQNAETGYAG